MGKADRIVLFALAVSLFANVGLIFLWRQSRMAVSAHSRAEFDSKTLPPVGARLDGVHLLRTNGDPAYFKLGPNELPIVAYILSPTCKFCELNQSNIDSLASQLRGRYRVVGISTTEVGLAPYVAEKSPPFPVYYIDSKVPHPDIKMSVTPETLVFSSDGTFVRGWNGAYTKEIKEELSSFFRAKLPE